ncbi:MAG TPA: hypothetical protein VGH74_01560 [Planctomycetaceae bacterium]
MAWGLIPGMTAVYICDYLVCRWLIGDIAGIDMPRAGSEIAQVVAGVVAGYAGIRFRMGREKIPPDAP